MATACTCIHFAVVNQKSLIYLGIDLYFSHSFVDVLRPLTCCKMPLALTLTVGVYSDYQCPLVLMYLFHYFQVFPLCLPSMWICAWGEFVPLSPSVFSFFHSVTEMAWPVPTLTCEQRAEAAEVTLVYLPTSLFVFHLTLHTGNETLLFWDAWGGENTPPRSYAIYKHKILKKCSIFPSWCFSRMANTPRGPRVEPMKGLLDGHGEHSSGEGVEVFCHGWTWASGGD